MDSVVVVVFSQLLLQPHLNGINGGDTLLLLAFSTHFCLNPQKAGKRQLMPLGLPRNA